MEQCSDAADVRKHAAILKLMELGLKLLRVLAADHYPWAVTIVGRLDGGNQWGFYDAVGQFFSSQIGYLLAMQGWGLRAPTKLRNYSAEAATSAAVM